MLKRSKWRPIAIAVFAVLLLAVAAFFFFLMRLDVLTTDYLLLVIAVAVLFVYIAGVLLFFGMRRKRSPARRVRRIIGIVLSLVLAAAFLFGATVLNKVEHALFVIVLIASLFMLWATAVMIVIPIKESTKYIMDNKPLPTKGITGFDSK